MAFYLCPDLIEATILNPNAEFGTEVFGLTHENFTLCGYSGSTTETYAAANGHKFAVLAKPTFTPGDISGDGLLDLSDAILLFQHTMLPDLYPVSYTGSMDFTKDGSLDIADAILLFQHSMLPDLYPIA